MLPSLASLHRAFRIYLQHLKDHLSGCHVNILEDDDEQSEKAA
jgi:hypothetical protein